MKSILLRLDEGFFIKMKIDKLVRERRLKKFLNWEEYIKLLFGITKDNTLKLA